MKSRNLVTGLLVAVVVVAAYLLLSGGSDNYTLKAELANAGGVKENSSVKIAGVPGGTVKKLEVTPRDTAVLTMELDKDAAPIGEGAKVEIRPTDLLGERYVALEAGDVNKPEPSGFTIPKNRTALPVELDDALNTFDGTTRQQIKILINEFGVALGSRGKDLAKLLDAMPPSLTDARQLVTEITDEDESLKALLSRGDSLTAAVEPKKDKLASLVTQASVTLKELSDRREKLGRTLDSAPGGLSALNRTLTQLRSTSTALRPASVDIKNAAAPLKDTLDALPGFEQSARDSLKAANKAAPSLTKLGKKATGPLQALTPTLANLRTFSSDLKPTLDVFDDRAFDDAMWFAQNLGGRGLKNKDNLGHTLGAIATGNPQTVRAVLNSLFEGGGGTSGNVDGQKSRSKSSDSKSPSSDTGTTTTSPAPSTNSTAPPASTGTTPAAPPSKGLLGDLVGGVSGLLGGDAGAKNQPSDAPKGDAVSGLLNSLLGK